MKTLHFYNTNR